MASPPSFSSQDNHMGTSARRETELHVGGHYHGPIGGNQGGVDTIDVSQDTEKLLQSLPGWDLHGVRFDESKGCLSGTRRQLLADIRQWVESPGGEHILWISGMAGIGKSSVAHSCAADFDRSQCLGASFFFNPSIPKPDYLITNLSYQLANFDPRLKEKILSAIQSMGHIPAWSLRSQARKLIVEPTIEAKLDERVVVVIDAVDEAGTMGMRGSLLEAIVGEFCNLPDYVKVIVTSRDESDIRASLENRSDAINIEDADNIETAIVTYIQHRFETMRKRSNLPQTWPPQDMLQALCLRAERLFIWASVACSYVDSGRDHTRRLKEVLDVMNDQQGPTPPLSSLNSLYNHIFETVFPIEDGHPADYHYVVGAICVLQSPLTRIELDSLLGFGPNLDEDGVILPDGQVIYLSSSGVIIDSLPSVFREDTTGDGRTDGPIRLLHPLLGDFLTTHADDHLRINIAAQHQTVAIRCLHVMNSQLKFDICDIGDASLPNIDISETSHYISPALRYSCFSFVYHLTNVLDPNAVLISALTEFVYEHILHWIEAMSLLHGITDAEQCVRSLASWMKNPPGVATQMEMIVRDVVALLRNCGRCVRISALHTYCSGLALTRQSGELYKCWIGKVHGIPHVTCSHTIWPASVRVLEGHTDLVNDVGFSPNGKMLASASSDNTVRLWDVESGQPVGDPLKGHTHWVNHVIFSPDGKKLASASFDNTVRLWDVVSGQPMDPLEGHTNTVNHVVFSPDGEKLASASYDNTLRLWNVRSGQPIGNALEGHTHLVNHVVFSPDGTRLASASSDNTARLWEVHSGQLIGDPLEGHTNPVNHVAFSPDGTKLASASYDNTVRLWDMKIDQPIGYTLKGHTNPVTHVVFSPDGMKLASASYDNTLRIWDVGSRKPIGDPLEGHSDWVKHVVFSPDGKKLASASSDNTLRLWDVESGQPIGEALRGHTDSVYHVVFLPDGKKLASASSDNTLRLWDVESGQPIGDVPTGHTSSITHVVFSPDGNKLASSSSDNMLHLWDVRSGQLIGKALKGHTDLVTHAVFSSDGKKLASASYDNTLRLWDVESGLPIGDVLKGHTDWVNYVVFSPNGKKLASASHDNTLRLWDVECNQPIGDPLKGHTDIVTHVVFSPDGKKLASASHDNTLRLWDVGSGQPIRAALAGHTNGVHHLVFSPDGKQLVSVPEDQTLQHWDVASGQSIRQVDASSSASSLHDHHCHFDSEGYLLHGSKRLIWLPVPLRGCTAVSSSSVVVGGRSGAVTFIHWPVPLSYVGVLRQM